MTPRWLDLVVLFLVSYSHLITVSRLKSLLSGNQFSLMSSSKLFLLMWTAADLHLTSRQTALILKKQNDVPEVESCETDRGDPLNLLFYLSFIRLIPATAVWDTLRLCNGRPSLLWAVIEKWRVARRSSWLPHVGRIQSSRNRCLSAANVWFQHRGLCFV